MKLRSLNARRIGVLMFSLCIFGLLTSPSMPAEVKFFEEPVVEKKVAELPSGPLYWRLENFPTLAQAQGAAGPTSLAAEVAGKVWLFTLGPKDGATAGGTKVVEIGPLPIGTPFPPLNASEYLLRVSHAGGVPGAKTPIHMHPGPEAFYVLSGKLGMHMNTGVFYAEAGKTVAGSGIGDHAPMEVFNAGTIDLEALAIFVVDANRPFSSPAKLF
jgi:quercetin dioxygenase-like cupin family protein